MGHPGRRAMLRMARDEERSAAELAEVAGLSPSAASGSSRQWRASEPSRFYSLFRIVLAKAGRSVIITSTPLLLQSNISSGVLAVQTKIF